VLITRITLRVISGYVTLFYIIISLIRINLKNQSGGRKLGSTIHFYLKNQTHINVHYVVEIFYSLTITFTLAVNFFKLRRNSLKLVLFIFSNLIFFLINLILNFKLFSPISLLIIIIITIYTYKNAEYNFI